MAWWSVTVGLTPGAEIFLLATLSRPSVGPTRSFLSGWYEWFFAPPSWLRNQLTPGCLCPTPTHFHSCYPNFYSHAKAKKQIQMRFALKASGSIGRPENTWPVFVTPPPVRHFPPHPFVSAPGFSSWTIREAVLYSIYCGERFPVTSRIDRFQGNRLNAMASAYAKRTI